MAKLQRFRLCPSAFTGAFVLCMLMTPGPLRGTTTRIFQIDSASAVGEMWINLAVKTGSHTIELRNFSTDANPVVHLMDNSMKQVGSAVPVAGAGLMFSVDGKLSGQFLVVVRSQSSLALNTGDLWVDGKLNTGQVTFTSGTVFRMDQLQASEKVMGVRQPLGPAGHIVYLLTADGRTILKRSAGVYTSVSPASTQDVLAVIASTSPSISGPLRVYRNDVAQDSDGDGLGDELEAALGTCATNSGSVAGVSCNEIADPRDTDGDGLQDGWEVLGREVDYKQGTATRHEYLALPAWGANPRHKDIFIEVDFRRLNLAENQGNVMDHMQPATARQMAAIYGDSATTDFWSKAIHALSVQNPDRLPGISLHLDTGIAPEHPEDATIYGDWGGYNAVDAIPDPNNPGAYIPQDPGVWKQQMSPGRQGIFHYVMGYTTGGGACGEGIACGFNMSDSGNSAHEFGHTIGLNHNGPYTVADEPNCKPNYPSLMNYAYLYAGYHQFSDGRNFPNFNNHALLETNAVDPANLPLITALETDFGYRIDHASGSVDWNRDGLFAPSGIPVRAYANYQPGGECEFTREGMQDTGLHSQLSPAIVRFNNTLWVFAIDLDGKLAWTYPPLFACSPLNIDACSTQAFYPASIRDLGPLSAIDAKTMVINGAETIILVGIRPDGTLLETFLQMQGGQQVWGPVVAIPGSPATGEPSVANTLEKTGLALTYKGQDNIVRIRYRSATGWGPEQQVAVGGQPLTISPNSSPAVVYTTLPVGGIVATGEHLMLASADAQGQLQFYTPQFPGNHWGRIGIPYSSMSSPVGRPVMAFTGFNTSVVVTAGSARAVVTPSSTYGRLYVLYLQYQTPPPTVQSPINPIQMSMSYVDNTGKLRIGLDADFDDEWSYAYGMSLVTPTDGALRAAVTSAVLPSHMPPQNEVFFRPHADGISDLTYHNYDDWKTLAHDACTVLTTYQTDSPVKCAAIW